MYEWQQYIQTIIDEIERCIKDGADDAPTLTYLSEKLGYSEFHTTRKFREISGMSFKDYLRLRRLAYAFIQVRDTDRRIIDIAIDAGFSSNEAFTRAFKKAYGIAPAEYRLNPVPVVLRTKMYSFNRYSLGLGEIGMKKSNHEIKTYFVTIPAHKFLHIRNYESNGYMDFWDKQSKIEGQDWDTITGLLDSIKGKLDDEGGTDSNSGSGQIMAFIHDPKGKPFCYGVPRAECYGVRLPMDYSGELPSQMTVTDVPEADYIVFEHGPFDYEQENGSVDEAMDKAIAEYDYAGTGYCFDDSPGRITYLFHDPERFWKWIRPVKKVYRETETFPLNRAMKMI